MSNGMDRISREMEAEKVLRGLMEGLGPNERMSIVVNDDVAFSLNRNDSISWVDIIED